MRPMVDRLTHRRVGEHAIELTAAPLSGRALIQHQQRVCRRYPRPIADERIGVARIRREEAHLGDVEADLRISIAKIGPLRINPTDKSLTETEVDHDRTAAAAFALREARLPPRPFPIVAAQSQRAFFVTA